MSNNEVKLGMETKGEPEGHQEAMIAKAEGVEVEAKETEEAPERPEWLPEKFSTVEEMAEAYKALEAKQGAGDAPKEGDKEDEEATNKAAEEAVEAAGLDMDALTSEFQENGELTADSLAKLEKAGIGKDMVDAYIAGQEALANQVQERIFERAGGEEAFKDMVAWGAENMTPEEVKAYNAAVDSGDEGQLNLALDGLSAKYRAANGSKPKLMGGRNGGSTADVFNSSSELTAAMRDPRYKTDPAYRKSVEEKLARSDKF